MQTIVIPSRIVGDAGTMTTTITTKHEPYQILPDLSHEEYQSLKADIRINGVLVPLVIDEAGNILDGHQRNRIIQELLAEGCRVKYLSIIRAGLSEQQKRLLVLALHLHRRHLTQAQRRELIAQQLKETPQKSDRQVAAALGVSPTTVGTIRGDLEAGGEVSRLDTRTDTKGRKQPSTKPPKPGSASVVALNEQEVHRAFTALAGMRPEALPDHPVPVKRLERIRRETDCAERAARVKEEPSVVDSADIRLGDFRQVLNDIGDGTTDLVLTDPPWSREHLLLWDDLGAFAARVLRPGGLLVTYAGQGLLPTVLASLTAHLEYIWAIAQVGRGRKVHNHNLKVYANWKPILIFVKPPFQPARWFDDLLLGGGGEKAKHRFQQAEDEAVWLVETFSRRGDLVIDPFLGSGTTGAASVSLGRRFVGSDIDPAAVGTSRERVRSMIADASNGLSNDAAPPDAEP